MGRQIAIDSSIVIYLIERNREFIEKVRPIFLKIQAGKYRAVLSVIGIIEILTGPKKQGRFGEASKYHRIIKDFPNLTIGNINNNIIELASDLRAKYKLATPDAVHVATALDYRAETFITNDATLKKIKEIKIQTLANL